MILTRFRQRLSIFMKRSNRVPERSNQASFHQPELKIQNLEMRLWGQKKSSPFRNLCYFLKSGLNFKFKKLTF